jgi:hypothetical protein
LWVLEQLQGGGVANETVIVKSVEEGVDCCMIVVFVYNYVFMCLCMHLYVVYDLTWLCLCGQAVGKKAVNCCSDVFFV